MALEEELIRRLKLQSTRVFSPTATFNTPRPYVTWQHIGGQAVRYVDNTAPDKRNAFIQINAWADNKKAALDLLRKIEEELCIVTDGKFVAVPMEEPSDAYIEGNEGQQPGQLCGALQTFRVWGVRVDPPAPAPLP